MAGFSLKPTGEIAMHYECPCIICEPEQGFHSMKNPAYALVPSALCLLTVCAGCKPDTQATPPPQATRSDDKVEGDLVTSKINKEGVMVYTTNAVVLTIDPSPKAKTETNISSSTITTNRETGPNK